MKLMSFIFAICIFTTSSHAKFCSMHDANLNIFNPVCWITEEARSAYDSSTKKVSLESGRCSSNTDRLRFSRFDIVKAHNETWIARHRAIFGTYTNNQSGQKVKVASTRNRSQSNEESFNQSDVNFEVLKDGKVAIFANFRILHVFSNCVVETNADNSNQRKDLEEFEADLAIYQSTYSTGQKLSETLKIFEINLQQDIPFRHYSNLAIPAGTTLYARLIPDSPWSLKKIKDGKMPVSIHFNYIYDYGDMPDYYNKHTQPTKFGKVDLVLDLNKEIEPQVLNTLRSGIYF